MSAPTALSVLRQRPRFLRLWCGALLSSLGDHLSWIALTWLVLQKTHSGTAVGGILLASALPAVLTGPLLGHWLDRYLPRPIMLWDNLLRAVLIALIPQLDHFGMLPLWSVYLLAGLSGALSPATEIGTRLMTPALVRDEELEAANSALSLTWQVGLVTGPLVAGMLIDRGGVHLALYADALSFLAMALALFGLPNAVKREDSAPGDADERGSVRTLLSYPIVLALTGLTFAFDSAYGPTEAALPVRLTETFHATALQFGSLWSGFGSGAMLGGLLAPLLARCLPIGLALAAIATTWGICQMGIAFAPGVAATLALFTIGGIIWGPYPALETSLIQRTVPQHLWGRVFGARTALLRPALPAGMALGGLLLRFFTPQMVIALSAGACLLAGVAGLCWRRLRRAGMPENALTSDSKAV